MIEGYREGTVPLLKMVSDDDTIGDYYNFLFSKFKVKLIPYLTDKERKEPLLVDSHKYLLDFTSLLLLFEFSLLHPEVEFKHKFTISPFLAELAKAYRKNARVLASFPLYEAMQQGHIHHFSENISEDIDLRLDALLSWIQVHCVVVQDTAVLRVSDPAQTPTSQLFVNTYIGLIDENKDSNVLISDDFNIERMVKAPLPSISSETYIYTHMGAEVGNQYSIFLCENNCLGSNVPSDYIVEQYSLFENGKDSKLMNILDPDHLSSDVATMLRACHGIINNAQNKGTASSTIRTLLVNLFRFANKDFVSSQAWKGIYFIQQQSGVGSKYICPVLDEIRNKAMINKTE